MHRIPLPKMIYFDTPMITLMIVLMLMKMVTKEGGVLRKVVVGGGSRGERYSGGKGVFQVPVLCPQLPLCLYIVVSILAAVNGKAS